MNGYSDILGPVDCAFYFTDRPETPMNIGALVIYDGYMDFRELIRLIESRIHEIPRYRQRVIQPPLRMGQPTWVDDPDFVISRHALRVTLAPPATDEALRDLAGSLLSSMLPRHKPLWEVYFIEGLKDRTALFFKVHHCMVDGLAAVELFTMLMDFSPEKRPLEPAVPVDVPRLPNPLQFTLDAFVRDQGYRFGLLDKLRKETARLTTVMLDPQQRLKALVAIAHLINGNLRPIKKLPINGRNSGEQALVWNEFSLDEIHAIRRKVQASVNDVMLAVLTAAIQKYAARRTPREQPFLRILVPVNIREEAEKGTYGNRISVLPVDVPLEMADPLKRLEATMKNSTVMKESSLSLTMDLVLTIPSLMPSFVQPGVWNLAPVAFSILAHTWCTNVAASPVPVYLLGHELKHVYGFFPLNPTMGLAAVVVSYNGRVTMTLVVDKAIIDNQDELREDVLQAYVELREAAHVSAGKALVTAQEVTSPAEIGVSMTQPSAPEAASPGAETAVSAEAIPVLAATIDPPEATPVSPEKAATAAAPAPPAEPEKPKRHKLFSEEWARAFREVINHSDDYRRASTGWTAGSLAFVLQTGSRSDSVQPAAVFLDLHRGECKSARALSPAEAHQTATFVIEGPHQVWVDVLHGKLSPLPALTSGKLHLRKGSMLRLMPHTRSAGELVKCARRVPWE